MNFNLSAIFDDLKRKGAARLFVGGELYLARVYEDGNKIRYASRVFVGGNYLPKSVKSAVMEAYLTGELDQGFHLQISEEDASVTLAYQADFSGGDPRAFNSQFSAYLADAEEWRYRLEGLGKEDLVHVAVS